MNVTSGASSVGAVGDGSIELLTAFCNSAIANEKNDRLVEEAYYSAVYALLGLQAMDEKRIVNFPKELTI
jgi:hypothetical protein